MSDVDYCPSCGEVLLTRTEFKEDLVLNVYRTEFRCGKCKFHGEVFRISPPDDTTTGHIGDDR